MAFTRKVLAGLVTIVTVVLGLSLAVAGPAAADTGNWKPYGNTNPITSSSSDWACTPTKEIGYRLGAQVCAIRSPSGGSAQGAVIVRNNQPNNFLVDASVRLIDANSGDVLGDWACSRSGVGKNSWSVCYGDTLTHRDSVFSSGYANNIHLGYTINN
jgi:hypothetical protein